MTAGADANPAAVPSPSPKPPKEDRRWLMAAVIAIAAVFVVIVAAFALGVFAARGPAPVPLGTALAIDNISVGSGPQPSLWYYKFYVASVAQNLTLADFGFNVETSNGVMVSAPAGSYMNMIADTSGDTVANYTFSDRAWSVPASSQRVSEIDYFRIVWNDTTPTNPLEGDSLVLSGSDGYSGTLSYEFA